KYSFLPTSPVDRCNCLQPPIDGTTVKSQKLGISAYTLFCLYHELISILGIQHHSIAKANKRFNPSRGSFHPLNLEDIDETKRSLLVLQDDLISHIRCDGSTGA